MVTAPSTVLIYQKANCALAVQSLRKQQANWAMNVLTLKSQAI